MTVQVEAVETPQPYGKHFVSKLKLAHHSHIYIRLSPQFADSKTAESHAVRGRVREATGCMR